MSKHVFSLPKNFINTRFKSRVHRKTQKTTFTLKVAWRLLLQKTETNCLCCEIKTPSPAVAELDGVSNKGKFVITNMLLLH